MRQFFAVNWQKIAEYWRKIGEFGEIGEIWRKIGEYVW
jgi:hypothetical protein